MWISNGRVVTTKEAADGAEVATADVLFPVEADHAITGWYTDAAFTTPVTTVTIDKANVTLYAKVEAGHWLTFDSKRRLLCGARVRVQRQDGHAAHRPHQARLCL